MKDKTLGRFVTFNKQKDGRSILGTAIHIYLNCPCLKRTSSRIIDIRLCQELVDSLDKCSFCFNRK